MYQLVFFIHIYITYHWLKVAFGIFCLGKNAVGIFYLAACGAFYNVMKLSFPFLSVLGERHWWKDIKVEACFVGGGGGGGQGSFVSSTKDWFIQSCFVHRCGRQCQHHLCTALLATGSDTETSYLVHICTYAPHICT